MPAPPTRRAFRVQPHPNHVLGLPLRHQTEGNTFVQLRLQQLNSPIVLGWLLWNYLCWGSATRLWVSLNPSLNKPQESNGVRGRAWRRAPLPCPACPAARGSRPFFSSGSLQRTWFEKESWGLKRELFLFCFQCLWPKLGQCVRWAAKERNAWVTLRSGVTFSVVLILT